MICIFIESEREREGGNTDDIGTTARTSPVSGCSSMQSKPAVRGPSVYLSRYSVQYSSLQLKRRGLIILVSIANRPQDKNSCGDHGETHRSTKDAPPLSTSNPHHIQNLMQQRIHDLTLCLCCVCKIDPRGGGGRQRLLMAATLVYPAGKLRRHLL